MNLIPDSKSDSEEAQPPRQAELYDNLKRIGELEDQKQDIQREITQLTDQLRDALQHLDPNSLLHQMLDAALKPKPAADKPARKTTKKSTATKKTRRRKTKKKVSR